MTVIESDRVIRILGRCIARIRAGGANEGTVEFCRSHFEKFAGIAVKSLCCHNRYNNDNDNN